MLSQRLGVPAIVGNDANLAALGEHRYGAGKGVRDLVFLAVSTGIGAGIMIGGELFTGSAGFAGEVGHMTVDSHGLYVLRTMPGALELLCSGTALARTATDRITAEEHSSMGDVLREANRERLTAREVFAAYHSGDALRSQSSPTLSYTLVRTDECREPAQPGADHHRGRACERVGRLHRPRGRPHACADVRRHRETDPCSSACTGVSIRLGVH